MQLTSQQNIIANRYVEQTNTKTNLNRFKTTEITQSMLFKHNEVNLEINNKYSRKISKYLENKQHVSKEFTSQRDGLKGCQKVH